MIGRTLIVAVIGPISAVSMLQGQSVNPKYVPLELIQGIAWGAPFEERAAVPDVYVGRLPDATTQLLPLPRGSRIIGSVAARGFSTNLVDISAPLAAARDTLEAKLIAAGWRKHEWSRSQGGFESTSDLGRTFCLGDSMALSPAFKENPRGGTRLLAVHLTRAPYMPCRFDEDSGPPQIPKLIPSLAAPAGAVVVSMGTNGGSAEQSANARIITKQTVGELSQHYGAQLIAAGWKPIRKLTSEDLGIESYRVTDIKGADWHAVLTISTTNAEAARFVTVRVTREKSDY